MDPALVIRRESAGRHDAVDVRMADQRLPPRVEDAQHADLGAEMAWVRGDLAERRRARLKEPGVQTGAVPIGQRQERMREREDDVHIRHVEQLALARAEPALARLRLALRAVPIPARVIGDGLMPAGVTPIEMPAERGGPTARDRAEHGSAAARSATDAARGRCHPARGGYRPPPPQAGSCRTRLPLQPRPREDHGRGHLQLLQRIRRRLEVPLRQMQIHGRVREVRVAEEDLNRPQVCAGLQEMRRVRMSQRVRADATIDAGRLRGEAHRVPDALGGERLVGAPAVFLPGKRYVCGRIHR